MKLLGVFAKLLLTRLRPFLRRFLGSSAMRCFTLQHPTSNLVSINLSQRNRLSLLLLTLLLVILGVMLLKHASVGLPGEDMWIIVYQAYIQVHFLCWDMLSESVSFLAGSMRRGGLLGLHVLL